MNDAGSQLLLRGNRTLVSRFEASEGPRVRKELLAFADVSIERAALHREAYLQALASGPGVIGILGGELPSGEPCEAPQALPGELRALVRRFVAGRSLRELLADPSSARLTRDRAFSWTRRLLATLSRLHSLTDLEGRALGLFHRDVTADNVLLDAQGEIWLNDFGLAHLATWGPLEDSQLMMGARECLAPEVRAGEQPGPASDVFQAGWLCAQLLEPSRAREKGLTPHDMVRLGSVFGWPPVLLAALASDPAVRPSAARFADALH